MAAHAVDYQSTTARIAAIRHISTAFVEISLEHEDAVALAGVPGDGVLIHLTDKSGQTLSRRYGVRAVDAATKQLTVWVSVDHYGVGASWADGLSLGDEVEIEGPFTTMTLAPGVDWHLFIGDMPAIATFYRLGELVEPPSKVAFIMQINNIDAAITEALRKGFDATAFFVERSHRHHGDPASLLHGLSNFEFPEGTLHAYLLGEADTVDLLREALMMRGLREDQISTRALWRQSVNNLSNGQPDLA